MEQFAAGLERARSSCSLSRQTLQAASIILIWIALSSAVIFQNKYLLSQFPYPITLTACHLLYQTIATRLVRIYWPALFRRGRRTTSDVKYSPIASASNSSSPDIAKENDNDTVLDIKAEVLDAEAHPVEQSIDRAIFFRKLIPIGVLFAASLVLSNLVYLYLSVSTIQMLKAASPIAVMITSFAFGLKEPSLRLVSIILLICSGVGVASTGAADFQLMGFSIQAAAIAVEATRLALIQTLLHGLGWTPLESLHAFAPICLATLVVLMPIEGLTALVRLPQLGIATLFANATLTFLLNISAVMLIDLSSLVLSLSKVVKDILLIVFGTVFLGETITKTQWFGYTVALAGLFAYKFYG